MSTIRVKVSQSEGGGMFSSGGNEGVEVRIETMDQGLDTDQFSERVAALTVAADTLIRSVREADEGGPVEGDEAEETDEAEFAPVSAADVATEAAATETRIRTMSAISNALNSQDLVVISGTDTFGALVSGIYETLHEAGVLR